jgi:peptidoglycan hydrolase-like protein with peptidoglycan-binding domain
MAVRETESKLPFDFEAFELGQSVEDGDIALVSYLTSPIAIGSTIDYVLFLRNVPESDREDWKYNWMTERVSTGEIIEKKNGKKDGIFSSKPEFLGNIRTSVEVIHGRNSITLEMIQEVIYLNPILETFLGNNESLNRLSLDESIGALGGNSVTSRELINNFGRYIDEAISPRIYIPYPRPVIDIPLRFLAAIVYSKILDNSEKWFDRDAKLAAAAAEFNNEISLLSFVPRAQFEDGLGVCSISPQTVAMVLDRPDSNLPFTDWTELPGDEDERKDFKKRILDNLNELPDAEDVKIDLFNLLRFPKTNIRMCAMILRRLIDRDIRWKNIESNQLLDHESGLEILATEYDIGAASSLLPPDARIPSIEGPPTEEDAKPNDFGLNVVNTIMKIPAIVIYFADSRSEFASAYGNLDLKRGDDDLHKKWEGKIHLPLAPEDTEDAAPQHYVKELQEDLKKLGFTLVKNPNGKFEPTTEWAVREFQIYAKMPALAKETTGAGDYISRLKQIVNILPYTGPISGVANLATRIVIQYWKANNWRCPVILGAYNTSGTTLFNASSENIWVKSDVESKTPRIFATDFTGYYDYSGSSTSNEVKKYKIGRWTNLSWKGPASLCAGLVATSDTSDCDSDAEVLPGNLITPGKQYNDTDSDNNKLTDTERSTFRVIRAVCENENLGFFDSITAYDRAIISSGVCHWTIALVKKNKVLDGELCAYLSYLKSRDTYAFGRVFKRFGLDVKESWMGKNGSNLFDSSVRKYTGWFKHQDDRSNYIDYPRVRDDVLYLASWHWFYRFVMAGRTNRQYCQYMWDMARFRIRDIRETRFKDTHAVPSILEDGKNRTARIRDIFTSEEAIAMLYRWHIYEPKEVVENGRVSKAIAEAVTSSGVPMADNDPQPSSWSHEQEQQLITRLKEAIDDVNENKSDDALQDTVEKAMEWPTYAGRSTRGYSFGAGVAQLSNERNSFKFHETDLEKSIQ